MSVFLRQNKKKYLGPPAMTASVTDYGHSLWHIRSRKEALPQLAGNISGRPSYVAEQQPAKFRRTVGVQADYRESETQTHPYCPDYVVRPGMAPSELLTLSCLTWGSGLPAGQAEMEMIDRARAQRKPPLPPLKVLSKLNKMRRIEEKILERHETHVAGLRYQLRQREEANAKRLQQYYTQLQTDGERFKQKMHRDQERVVRKLEDNRRDLERQVDDLLGGSREAGATSPLYHKNVLPKQIIPDVPMRFLQDYGALLEREGRLLSPETRVEDLRTNNSDLRHSQRYDQLLKLCNQDLQQQKAQKLQRKPPPLVFKKEVPVPRPSSPWMPEPSQGEEERERAVIYLQKLLKGRSIQYQVLKGKEKSKELIEELKTTNALQKEEQNIMKENAQRAQILQNQRDLNRHKTLEAAAHLAGLAGAELTDRLNTMSKELIHQQEQSRLRALALLAEQARRRREAKESGRRQVVEQRNREEDEVFTQVARVHQDTVDIYLDDILVTNIERDVDQQAREEICRMAREINASIMEESCSEHQSRETVSELVHSFLIPEVQKFIQRERAQQLQRKHLLAVHQIIQEAEHTTGPSEAPNLASPSDIL